MRTSTKTMLAAAILASSVVAGPATLAETIMLKADLKGSNEVPPNDSTAIGSAEASYDTFTRSFSATATFSGLSGPAIGAHLHGPGEAGANAGIMLRFESVTSPVQLSATLTEAQAADLLAGTWYVNIHTEQNPGGELRGQLTK